jgi:hypothetical protein
VAVVVDFLQVENILSRSSVRNLKPWSVFSRKYLASVLTSEGCEEKIYLVFFLKLENTKLDETFSILRKWEESEF